MLKKNWLKKQEETWWSWDSQIKKQHTYEFDIVAVLPHYEDVLTYLKSKESERETHIDLMKQMCGDGELQRW